MKKYLVGLIVLFGIVVQAQEIQWMTLAEALEAQKTVPKKIFMDVYTKWCGPCKLLDKRLLGTGMWHVTLASTIMQ